MDHPVSKDREDGEDTQKGLSSLFTCPSPPVHREVGVCCSRKEGVGRLCLREVNWVGLGKPLPWYCQQDSSRVLQGQCNMAAPSAGLLEQGSVAAWCRTH